MKTVFVGDLHLHPHQNRSEILPSGRNSRLQNGIDAFIKCIDKVSDGDRLIFAGDFFEDQREVPLDALDGAREILSILKRRNIEATFITGNHDQLSRDGLIHSIGLFDQPAHRIRVVDVPSIRDGYAWLPYRRPVDLPAAIEELKRLNPGELRMPLICHVDLIGATANSGHPSEKGIRLGDFPEWAFPIISGHYHKPQTIGDRFVYIGSPYQISAGEAGENKRCLVFNGSGTPSSVGDLESMPITGLPTFKTVNITEWDEMDEQSREQISDDFVTMEVPHGESLPEGVPDNVRAKPLPKPEAQIVGQASNTREAIEKWLVGRGRGDLLDRTLTYLETP